MVELCIGCLAVVLAAAFIIVKDGFTIARLRREKEEWRHKYIEQCNTRTHEATQDAERQADTRRAFEVKYGEAMAQCKAAGIMADGWRKAAERGRA